MEFICGEKKWEGNDTMLHLYNAQRHRKHFDISNLVSVTML